MRFIVSALMTGFSLVVVSDIRGLLLSKLVVLES